jgi:hypothetical protein
MAQMKIKYYNIKEEDVWLWWSTLKEDSCFKYINPVEVIRDIKTGTKEWYFQGVPLRIKTAQNAQKYGWRPKNLYSSK